ncbi:MAG: class I adenylate-forming enzyme family protein, partial [Pseudomonadota bacterium]
PQPRDRALHRTGLRRAGVSRGDRVFLRIGNTLDFPILFFAASGMGALPVPISPMVTTRELAEMEALLAPRLILQPESGAGGGPCRTLPIREARGFRDLPPSDWADTGAGDPAYCVFTSGTGGAPKAVVHAHRAAYARRMMWADWYGLRAGDRMLHAGAINWTFTLGTGLMDPWAAGATALIYTGPPAPRLWGQLAERLRPSLFAAAPGVYRQIVKPEVFRPAQFRSLRHGLSAGEAMPASVRARWEDATGIPVLEALGMTEISTYISQSPAKPGLYRPQTGRTVAILGETAPRPLAWEQPGRLSVAVDDPGLMLGYWENGAPRLPLEDGWFVTGDRAALRRDGHLTYLGRSDCLITTGGYRISPVEVEAVLTTHPAVAEAAVLPLAVRADVEVLTAVVAPAQAITEEILAGHCAKNLARYKTPRKFIFRDQLPRTGRGKTDYKALIAEHSWKAP